MVFFMALRGIKLSNKLKNKRNFLSLMFEWE